MPVKKYSDEQRAEALETCRGKGLAAAAKKTGIPRCTISRWAKAAGIATLHIQKTEAANRAKRASDEARLHAKVSELLDADDRLARMSQEPMYEYRGQKRVKVHDVPPPAEQKALMTARAIALDKIHLLKGLPNIRTENINKFEQMSKQDIEAYLHERYRLRLVYGSRGA